MDSRTAAQAAGFVAIGGTMQIPMRPLGAAAAFTLLLLAPAGARAEQANSAPVKAASRLRLLRSWTDTIKLDGGGELPRRVDIVFDYTKGIALERSYDGSGRLTQERTLEGPPQPSAEEIAEAFGIVRADPELGRILERTQAVLEGGFLLEEGEGQPCGPRTRCLQVQLLGPTRLGLVRYAVVDLVKRAIVYPTYTPSEGGVK
jgi:hypothetical protein